MDVATYDRVNADVLLEHVPKGRIVDVVVHGIVLASANQLFLSAGSAGHAAVEIRKLAKLVVQSVVLKSLHARSCALCLLRCPDVLIAQHGGAYDALVMQQGFQHVAVRAPPCRCRMTLPFFAVCFVLPSCDEETCLMHSVTSTNQTAKKNASNCVFSDQCPRCASPPLRYGGGGIRLTYQSGKCKLKGSPPV